METGKLFDNVYEAIASNCGGTVVQRGYDSLRALREEFAALTEWKRVHACSCEFSDGPEPEAIRLCFYHQGREERIASLTRKLEEARTLVIEANNSLYGSQGYFHSLNGGPFDKYHLASGIEDLKARLRNALDTDAHLASLRTAAADVLAESGSIGEHSVDNATAGCALCEALVRLSNVLSRDGDKGDASNVP